MREIPEWLKRDYFFHSRYLTLPGGWCYHYGENGVDGSEGTVVFLHGNPTWSFLWRYQASYLVDRGYHVIAPDHLGCGLSDKPQNYPYCLKQHIENLKILIHQVCRGPIVLVMHDWGGPIGLGWAVDHRDQVRGLVFCNTSLQFDAHYPWQIRLCRLPFLGRELIIWGNLFLHLAIKFGTIHVKLPKDAYLYPYRKREDRIAIVRFIEDIPMEMDHPTRFYGKTIAEKIKDLDNVPIAFIWGMRDVCFTPKFLEEAVQLFSSPTVWKLDAGHYVMEDRTREVNEYLISFLQNLDKINS